MRKSKILVVLRHGEADFTFGNGTDFQRELNQNGVDQLSRIKKLFGKASIKLDKIIASASVRTTQTAEIMAAELDKDIIEYSGEIYEAESSILLDVISKVSDDVENLMIIGHNPGVSALVSSIADQGYLNMQPGMLVIIELSVSQWKHVGIGTGIVREVMQ
ncbi:histidine phosphatase family protein [Belliella sp. R4-6]|uniref:Histidine phosphatase family protein n=1 Tax=Belliella alkalica TaxID=1730871 RepID=A0ABS9VGL6_9BACT|nr:histidine phosphatase family protein [Belliella alkalica]MCH7415582.1 histidine phosphatase family protein [Belliella alkalica]